MTVFYTMQQVSENDGKDNRPVWMIINDNVYDVSNYMDEHPGGQDLLLEWAGKDATKAFDEMGHSGDAHMVTKKFKIGELIKDARNGSKKTFGKSIESIVSDGKKKKRFSLLLCR